MDLETDLRLPARRVVEVKAVAGPDLWLEEEFQMLCPFLAFIFVSVCGIGIVVIPNPSVKTAAFFFFFSFVLSEVLRWDR